MQDIFLSIAEILIQQVSQLTGIKYIRVGYMSYGIRLMTKINLGRLRAFLSM